eukprot:2941884-Alexandrium_andersonii.AAC.1
MRVGGATGICLAVVPLTRDAHAAMSAARAPLSPWETGALLSAPRAANGGNKSKQIDKQYLHACNIYIREHLG